MLLLTSSLDLYRIETEYVSIDARLQQLHPRLIPDHTSQLQLRPGQRPSSSSAAGRPRRCMVAREKCREHTSPGIPP